MHVIVPFGKQYTVYVFESNRNATVGTELAGESSDLTSSELVHAAENGDEKKS